jgi:transposase
MKVKTSKHSLKDINFYKRKILNEFIEDYSNAVKFYVNYLWNNKFEYKVKNIIRVLDIKNDLLDCPTLISTTNINYETKLSQRALKCAANQACGIIRSIIYKRKRLLFLFEKLKGKRTRNISKKLRKEVLTYPKLNKIYPELNSICCVFEKSKNIKFFDGIMILSSLGKYYGKIILPIKLTKYSKKLEQKGNLLKSFLIKNEYICFRWEMKEIKLKTDGKIVGADTGINNVIYFSDKQHSIDDIHGHNLNSILKKIERKKKGSKSFHKALEHRNNYINWSVKQLNLSDIKEIRLEKISNFRHRQHISKFLNYFGETLIREKLIDFAQENGVHIIEQNSAYRSQRCSHCGYVNGNNRKGKIFVCKHCGFQADADYNASCNHEQNIPSAQNIFINLRGIKDFFWKANGFFNLDGSELTVSNKKK